MSESNESLRRYVEHEIAKVRAEFNNEMGKFHSTMHDFHIQLAVEIAEGRFFKRLWYAVLIGAMGWIGLQLVALIKP